MGTVEIKSTAEAMAALELKSITSKDDIKTAYRRLCKKYHPDVNSSPEAADSYEKVQKAYEYLNCYFTSMEYKPKVVGNTASYAQSNAKRESRARSQKVAREHQKKEAELIKQRQEEERIRKEKQRAKEVMDEIHTNRAAEITAEIIRSVFLNGAE